MSCKSLVAENFGQKCVCWTFRVAASQIYHTRSHRDVQKNWNKFSISWGTNTLTHLLSKRSQFLYLAPQIKNKFTCTHSQIWKYEIFGIFTQIGIILELKRIHIYLWRDQKTKGAMRRWITSYYCYFPFEVSSHLQLKKSNWSVNHKKGALCTVTRTHSLI